jgi:predicted nuclease of restriction endonuclease-like (RecB) superfamily
MLYERTALSRKPEALIRQELASLRDDDRLSPDLVFRDPYFLDFLGLQDTFAEKDLEAAILRDLEAFLLELGAGFTFVARQNRPIPADVPTRPTGIIVNVTFLQQSIRCLTRPHPRGT